jgi:ABC-type transport system involved in multi-copper enzyme maturation permease subunit
MSGEAMKTLIRHEFLGHAKSLQFAILLLLSILLFAANALVFVDSYGKKVDRYENMMASRGQGESTRITGVLCRPNPLTFVAEAGDSGRPAGYTVMPGGTLMAESAASRTFRLPDVSALDWSLIIRVFFSLYAILLGFQAISGEKEQGTLRLVLSNSMGRLRFLSAKYFTIILALTVPLGAGLLLNLALIGIFVPQVLTPDVFARIVLVTILALAFLSLFAFLSLLISCLVARSSIVLLILLSVWLLFTVIIPGASIVLVEKLSSAANEIQTARMFEPMVQKEVWDKVYAIIARAQKGEFGSEEEIRAESDRAFDEGQKKVNAFYEDFERAQEERARTAKNFSRLSPAALFQFALEGIVWTGDPAERDFLAQVREYSRAYDAYILEKLGEVVQTSRFSFGTTFDFKGERIQLSSPRPREYGGDKSDFPRFVERKPSPGRSLQRALFDLAGIMVWNIVLAGLAFSAFLRADVR